MSERPIDIWRRKLEHLRKAEAVASDPAQQFTIGEQIKDAMRHLAELQADLTTENPQQPAANDEPPSSDEPPPRDSEKNTMQVDEGAFDVFLSHNSKDKPVVRKLAESLRNRGLRVWLDEWELVPGRPWQEALENIIATAKSAAVLVGKDGLGPWEKPEMRGCLDEFVQRGLPVIPVLLPGASAKPTLPLFLRAFTWVDLRDGLDEKGIDGLEWGITGEKPRRREAPIKKPAITQSIDDVLLAYSNDRLAEWNRAWTNPDDPDRLVYYVPPHYWLVKPEHRESKLPDQGFPKHGVLAEQALTEGEPAMQRVPGATEEETLANLLKTSDRLCVSEGPGAGKSIFTRRVQAFLSSQSGRDTLLDGKPALAVRWEEWDGSWPDDIHVSLARQLEPYCGDSNRQGVSRDLVQSALESSRVVLILDALDQVGTEDSIRHLSDFLAESRRRGWTVRVVMTGRPFAIEQRKSTLLRDLAWRFACIEDFDAEQQYRYLYGPQTSNAVATGKPSAWSSRDLSRVEIKRLVSHADLSGDDGDSREGDIRSSLYGLFPNYDQVSELIGNPAVLAMVRGLAEEDDLRAFERRGDLYLRTGFVMLRRAAERLGESADATAIERTEAVLAAVACQMMVQDPNAYRVDGERRVARLREQAGRRIAGGVGGDEWRRIEKLTGLTNRSLLYGASHDVLAWHHKGLMEFYCGLHLARNSQPGWCEEQTDDQRRPYPSCGDAEVRLAAADPQWHWAFRFAIEMDEQLRDPKVLLATVSSLFEPPQSGHLRPTELMQRAWSLLEELRPHEWPDSRQPVLLPGGERIIARFRSQFQEILGNSNSPQHAVASGLLDAFLPCPPDEFIAACGDERDPYTFTMGTTDEDEGISGERPQHPVRLSPFQMMTTPVTRRQYALFDPNHEQLFDASLKKRSPDPGFPIVNVNSYDAWCFARWLDVNCRLPSEAQWECACRAGGEGMWCFGDDEQRLTKYAWYDEDWVKDSAHPVATKQPNAWGLYDMHGNVWEWCADWFDFDHYANSAQEDPTGPATGSYRVGRGGSWWLSAGLCRSAFRHWRSPADRGPEMGFRLTLVPSSQDR